MERIAPTSARASSGTRNPLALAGQRQHGVVTPRMGLPGTRGCIGFIFLYGSARSARSFIGPLAHCDSATHGSLLHIFMYGSEQLLHLGATEVQKGLYPALLANRLGPIERVKVPVG